MREDLVASEDTSFYNRRTFRASQYEAGSEAKKFGFNSSEVSAGTRVASVDQLPFLPNEKHDSSPSHSDFSSNH